MGDGKLVYSGGLRLCTNSYTLKEVVLLMNVLIHRYGLICTIHKSGPNRFIIFISKKSMERLRNIVKPYMVSSMFYKIHLTVPADLPPGLCLDIPILLKGRDGHDKCHHLKKTEAEGVNLNPEFVHLNPKFDQGPQYAINPNYQIGPYLAGLWEGAGHI